jgi:hypothetical protein
VPAFTVYSPAARTTAPTRSSGVPSPFQSGSPKVPFVPSTSPIAGSQGDTPEPDASTVTAETFGAAFVPASAYPSGFAPALLQMRSPLEIVQRRVEGVPLGGKVLGQVIIRVAIAVGADDPELLAAELLA